MDDLFREKRTSFFNADLNSHYKPGIPVDSDGKVFKEVKQLLKFYEEINHVEDKIWFLEKVLFCIERQHTNPEEHWLSCKLRKADESFFRSQYSLFKNKLSKGDRIHWEKSLKELIRLTSSLVADNFIINEYLSI